MSPCWPSLLQRLGCEMHWSSTDAGLAVDHRPPPASSRPVSTATSSRACRASVLLLGALLARCGEAHLPMPGGDAIGLRGIDFHVAGLRAMGRADQPRRRPIRATAPHGLRAADILLPGSPPSGRPRTCCSPPSWPAAGRQSRNAAREPENRRPRGLPDGDGRAYCRHRSHMLTIDGGHALAGAVQAVLPDGSSSARWPARAATTASCPAIRPYRPARRRRAAVRRGRRRDAGSRGSVIARRAAGGLRGHRLSRRALTPNCATDLQAPTMALLTVASGAAAITETVFEQRFRHVDELRKMGADISCAAGQRWCACARLQGASVTCTDVRAAAALVIAGLNASGETTSTGSITSIAGYDRMTEKLAAVGADIVRS